MLSSPIAYLRCDARTLIRLRQTCTTLLTSLDFPPFLSRLYSLMFSGVHQDTLQYPDIQQLHTVISCGQCDLTTLVKSHAILFVSSLSHLLLPHNTITIRYCSYGILPTREQVECLTPEDVDECLQEATTYNHTHVMRVILRYHPSTPIDKYVDIACQRDQVEIVTAAIKYEWCDTRCCIHTAIVHGSDRVFDVLVDRHYRDMGFYEDTHRSNIYAASMYKREKMMSALLGMQSSIDVVVRREIAEEGRRKREDKGNKMLGKDVCSCYPLPLV